MSTTALIIYDTNLISENIVITAVHRISDLITASVLKYLAAPQGVRESLPRRIRDYLSANPLDITDNRPLELPDEIWC